MILHMNTEQLTLPRKRQLWTALPGLKVSIKFHTSIASAIIELYDFELKCSIGNTSKQKDNILYITNGQHAMYY
jgi:hypothetical protein